MGEVIVEVWEVTVQVSGGVCGKGRGETRRGRVEGQEGEERGGGKEREGGEGKGGKEGEGEGGGGGGEGGGERGDRNLNMTSLLGVRHQHQMA